MLDLESPDGWYGAVRLGCQPLLGRSTVSSQVKPRRVMRCLPCTFPLTLENVSGSVAFELIVADLVVNSTVTTAFAMFIIEIKQSLRRSVLK